MSSYDRLIEQIDDFIRKFYKNRMLQGGLFFIGIFIVSYLFVTVFEYYGRFGSFVRGSLFFGFIILNIAVLYRYILQPLFKLYSFGKRLNRFQASDIIGTFFPDISDRLKNTLQLQSDLESQTGNIELLRASVQQRANQLSVVPFVSAIDYRENRKHARYLIPLFLLLVIIGVAAPSLLTQGTERIVNYDQEFKVPAPFTFNLFSKDLTIEEGEDLPVQVVLKGNELPEFVYLVSENGKFLMTKKSKNSFKGVIRKPKRSSSFHFLANDFESDTYQINLVGKAMIGKLNAQLNYPDYLGLKNEVVSNAGDMTIPEGTKVNWDVLTKNTEKITFKVGENKTSYSNTGFKRTDRFTEDTRVALFYKSSTTGKTDSLSFVVSVIKDAYPGIMVEELKDSVSDGLRFFTGKVSDDHGLKSLQFVYKVISAEGKSREERISVKKVIGTDMPFDFAVDFRREKLQLKDKIEYYFVVTDNDGVNGSKSTKSSVYTYQLPDLDELNEIRDKELDRSKKDLNNLLRQTEDFQRDLNKLKKDVLNSKSSDWNKLNKVKDLKDQQNELLKSLENLNKELNNSIEEKNQLSELDEELLQKQEMIEKLLEELMDDELKDLLDQLEKLMQGNNKDDLKNKLDDIEQSSEDMKNQLDRGLEMLKRLQVNEKIDDVEKELKELSKEQEELKKEIEENKLSKDAGSEKQQKLNEKFSELKEDIEELKKLNEDLMKPMDIESAFDKEESIEENMEGAEEDIKDGKSKKAIEKQQSAADDMKKMAESLDAMQQNSNKQQQEEDINSLRNILESLMTLSFDQEDLMLRFKRINDSDPVYKHLGRKQRSIINDTKQVRDSLMALAKRQPKIATFIDAELNTIAKNHELALEDIEERRKDALGVHQQYVMTSYNNLALLLNESLQSMQQQMQSMMEGSGSCNNPGGKGKPKPGNSMSTGDMKQMLKKQLENMQKGPNPGGKQPGDQEGEGMGNKPGSKGQNMLGIGNKEIAKMAAEQTAIRQRLEQLRNELNKDGKGSGNKLNPLIKELEQQEKDLINKNFSKEMVKRQQEILTRLLESEKALMERGFEEKRESKSGKNQNNGNQIRFEEYNHEKLRQIELLHSVDPGLNKYYRDKANEYFNTQDER
jgi:hypothetical protein